MRKIVDTIEQSAYKVIDVLRFDHDSSEVRGLNHDNEDQRYIDMRADDFFYDHLQPYVSVYASEEKKDLVAGWSATGPAVSMDPIDGSAGAASNGPLGSLYAIYKPGGVPSDRGDAVKAAGYILYGSMPIHIHADERGVRCRHLFHHKWYPITTPKEGKNKWVSVNPSRSRS